MTVYDIPAPQPVEFRDGLHMIPAYLAELMKGLPTHRMTYEQAVQAANQRLLSDHLNAQQDQILAAHFRDNR